MPILQHKDILQPGRVFDKLQKELNETNQEVVSLTKSLKTLQDQTRSVNKTGSGTEAKQRIDLTKQLNTATTKLIQSESQQAKQLALIRVATQEANKEKREEAKLLLKVGGEYAKQSKRLNELRKRYKEYALSERGATKEAKALLREITKLDSKLKKVDATVGQHQRSVGNYGRALKGVGRQLLGAAGITAGITGLVNVVRSGIKIFKDFSKSSSRLAAILKTNKDGIRGLTDQAKKLGATTAFTASQVISLQTELAKLGFSVREISDATPGILDLAAATGSELAPAAELAGATLRIFNLDASEMGRVTDVLAKSTTISSLSMEKLATILPTVGKTAQIAGVSLERTAALAGTLTDRGLEASVAATSLRNIFLELSKKGITWNEAMIKINSSTDKNKTAMDLFGKRAASAGVILSETANSTDDLTVSLEDATRAAQKMADVMLNNLAGDMTKAQSAWEGFILSVEDGDGVISRIVRGATQKFTGLLTVLRKLNEGESLALQGLKKSSKFQEQVNKKWKEYIRLLRLANTKEEEADIARAKRGRLQRQRVAIEFELRKLEEDEGGYKSYARLLQRKQKRAELEFTRDAYNELAERLKAFIPELKKESDALEEGSEKTNELTKKTNELTAAQKRLIEQQRKLKELQKERDKDRLETAALPEFDPLKATEAGTSFDLAKDATDRVNQMIIDENTNRRDIELAAEEEQARRIEDLKVQALQAGIQIISDQFAASQDQKVKQAQDRAAAEEAVLKDQLDKGLINQFEYERKLAESRKKARITEAKAEKNKALFDIGIQTAVAIVKALPNLFLVGVAIATGALQAAVVAARPIKFAKGGEVGGKPHSKGGTIIEAEKGEYVVRGSAYADSKGLVNAINEGHIKDSDIASGNIGGTSYDVMGLQDEMKKMNNSNDKLVSLFQNMGWSYESGEWKHFVRADGSKVSKKLIK